MKKAIFTPLLALLAMLTLSVNAQTDINGLVLYHMKANKPIPSVNLSLLNSEGVVIATAETDLNGSYSFSDIPYGSYTLTAETDISAGGVTMGDAFLIFLHLCNFYTFTPVQELAADVDGDGNVTWDDYWTVVIGWFVQGYPFPVGPWTFEDVPFTLNGTKTNVPTMGGSSAGDVNGTFVPSVRDLPAVETTYIAKQSSDNFTVEIYANDIYQADAMGMIINYPAQMVTIEGINSQLGEINSRAENGQIRVSWINQANSIAVVNPEDPILTIKASINQSAYDGSDIRFVIDPASHFCDYNGDQISTTYTLPLISAEGSFLNSNFPNPFTNNTTIRYTLPEESRVSISLCNQQGRLVKTITDEMEGAGMHLLNFNPEDLPAGVYFYTLQTYGKNPISETRRMIITR